MRLVECADMPENRGITSGTKEWADVNVNCIVGCMNNCRYCYAKTMAKRFGRTSDHDWQKMKIRKEALKKDYRKRLGRVMFPSTHDIFDISPFKEACFIVLAKLLASSNDVLITTKPRFTVVQEISERFRQYKDQIQFRFTITSIDDGHLRFWEPNAPSYEERMKSLRYAWRAGFKTSVSAEPFLDYDPTELITSLMPYVTESIWIGRMNYIPRQHVDREDEVHYNEIRKNYETTHVRILYNKLKRYPKIRFKDSIRIQLSHAVPPTNSIAPRRLMRQETITTLAGF
jgi:DNA repair photolyase